MVSTRPAIGERKATDYSHFLIKFIFVSDVRILKLFFSLLFMKYLCLLEHRGHGIESHSMHGRISVFRLWLCFSVSALRRADPPSMESYQVFIRFIVTDSLRNVIRSEGLISQKKKKKNIC
jgi:hypothetical protein